MVRFPNFLSHMTIFKIQSSGPPFMAYISSQRNAYQIRDGIGCGQGNRRMSLVLRKGTIFDGIKFEELPARQSMYRLIANLIFHPPSENCTHFTDIHLTQYHLISFLLHSRRDNSLEIISKKDNLKAKTNKLFIIS